MFSNEMTDDIYDSMTEVSKGAIKAKVICDSVNPDGCRLTTMEWTYPRMIHSEIMTHRQLSRNSASSRAIPLSKMIMRVKENPVFPIHWGKNQKGMQADEELTQEQKIEAACEWLNGRNEAVKIAEKLEKIGVHKQIGNRVLEPWMWITVIVSATNFENLFGLRVHKDAEPHFQNLAGKVMSVYDNHTPIKLNWGHWHLPYFAHNGGNPDNDWMFYTGDDNMNWPKISAGRCARVSYLTQDGKRNPEEDIKLYERLSSSFPLHASPLEHPAMAVNPLYIGTINNRKEPIKDWGNFDPGWLQFRKMHNNEVIKNRVK